MVRNGTVPCTMKQVCVNSLLLIGLLLCGLHAAQAKLSSSEGSKTAFVAMPTRYGEQQQWSLLRAPQALTAVSIAMCSWVQHPSTLMQQAVYIEYAVHTHDWIWVRTNANAQHL